MPLAMCIPNKAWFDKAQPRMESMLSGVALVSVRTQVCARAQSVSKAVAIAELLTVAAKPAELSIYVMRFSLPQYQKMAVLNASGLSWLAEASVAHVPLGGYQGSSSRIIIIIKDDSLVPL